MLTDPFQVKVICGVATSSNRGHVDVENSSESWSWSDAVEEFLIVGDAEVSVAGHGDQMRDFSVVI